MAERRIRAVASRQGRWWFVDLPGIGASTQARRSADIAWMARECAAMTLDVDDASIAIDVAYVLPDDARRRWDESRTKAEHARAEAAEAAALARQVIGGLRADGYSLTDLAAMLGLSTQRVHQLAQRDGSAADAASTADGAGD